MLILLIVSTISVFLQSFFVNQNVFCKYIKKYEFKNAFERKQYFSSKVSICISKDVGFVFAIILQKTKKIRKSTEIQLLKNRNYFRIKI